MKAQPKVLALDLGTKMGFAITHFDDPDRMHLISGGVTLPGIKFGKAARYNAFVELLNGMHDDFPEIRLVVFERVIRHSSSAAAHMYGAWMALVEMWAYPKGIKVEEHSVSSIRKFATGNGNAKKEQALRTMTDLFPHFEYRTDDESDALWLLLYAMRKVAGYDLDFMRGFDWRHLNTEVNMIEMQREPVPGVPDWN